MAAARPHDDLKLHLHVLGDDHELDVRARIGPTRLMEVLPLARAISEGVIGIAVEKVHAGGESISCKKGCTWCCHHLVPVSPAEAVRLAEVVDALPGEQRRAVKKRFEEAVKLLETEGLIEPRTTRARAALLETEGSVSERWQQAGLRYFEKKPPCPFLEGGACTIYAERPMVCREYSVTTPPELCEKVDAGLRTTPRPVHMPEVMTSFTNQALGRRDFVIPLPLALEWAKTNRRAFDVQGDGEELAMTLVQCIQDADDASGSG